MIVFSSYPPMAKSKIYFIYFLSSVPALCFITFGAAIGIPWIDCLPIFLPASVFILFGHIIVSEAKERKYGMVVTNVGVSISPRHCALWSEIKAWDFRSYSCLGRIRSTSDNVSLCLFVDDLNICSGQFSAGRAGSAFAARGYFLDEDQQEQWRQICCEKNIPRTV